VERLVAQLLELFELRSRRLVARGHGGAD
jgi:hypothetical protein